jgi:hypothetical protein
MSKDDDIKLLERAVALDTITVEQRRAFSRMRDALEQREHVALSLKQRLWVEQVLERGAGTTGLAALKTILSNLDGIGVAESAYAKSGGTEKAPGFGAEALLDHGERPRDFDVDSFVDEPHHEDAPQDDDPIPF